MAHDVFISCTAADKPVGDAICATLEANAIRCWIAPRDIMPGINWGEAIIEAINECRVMVLVFSSNANTSNHITREVERAVNRGLPIIPVRIEDIVPEGALEYFLSTPHWLDAFSGGITDHLTKVVEVTRVLVGQANSGMTTKYSRAVLKPETGFATMPAKIDLKKAEAFIEDAVEQIVLDGAPDAIQKLVTKALAAGLAPKAVIKLLATGFAGRPETGFYTSATISTSLKAEIRKTDLMELVGNNEVYFYGATGTKVLFISASWYVIFCSSGICFKNGSDPAQMVSYLSKDCANPRVAEFDVRIGKGKIGMLDKQNVLLARLIPTLHWVAGRTVEMD